MEDDQFFLPETIWDRFPEYEAEVGTLLFAYGEEKTERILLEARRLKKKIKFLYAPEGEDRAGYCDYLEYRLID